MAKTERRNYSFPKATTELMEKLCALERRSETQLIEIAIEQMAATQNLLPTGKEGKKKK